MSTRPRIARTVPALRRAMEPFARATVALVPTMGALHDGHIALVRQARKRARRVVVSIFVNPTQFAPNEDFGSYPRTFNSDLKALAAEKVELVWAPTAQVMYPEGFATKIDPQGAAKVGLEDTFRPHFFSGVATVVAKLFTQVRPDCALFGEKDYQQLRVVTAMARDLDLGVKVIGIPTVREKDGLAMSSRNAYLTEHERKMAPVLYRTLKASAKAIKQGETIERVLEQGRAHIEQAGFALDYLEARNAGTLAKVQSLKDGPLRLLVAAKIGKTRLIDNIAI
ncbi:MAG: pantoate--beta-alanine ligase [Pseudolabrys sp.]|nr:pantoate--beta-alanine ligase [Pseudolabrys sp.]MBV9953938.1 pantoate--beta-alanine ligase [Pseudolabrys sp.]